MEEASDRTSIVDYNFVPTFWYRTTVHVAQIVLVSSALCSSCIISLILRQQKKKATTSTTRLWWWPSSLYHRLVFCMSVMDVLFSFPSAFTPWAIVRETGLPLAVGNHATCSLAGFIGCFYCASLFYNSYLSVYFLLSICYGWTEERLVRLLEPTTHILSIGFPLAIAIAALSTQSFNPQGVFSNCYIAGYPYTCSFDSTVDCERGRYAKHILYCTFAAVAVSAVFGFVCTWMIYCKIRGRYSQSMRFSMATEEQQKRLTSVGIQAIMYSVVHLGMLLETIFVGVVSISPGTDSWRNTVGLCIAMFVFYVYLSSLGILNFWIFIRPRWLPWRSAFREKSMLWAIYQVLADRPLPSTRATNHLQIEANAELENGETGDPSQSEEQ